MGVDEDQWARAAPKTVRSGAGSSHVDLLSPGGT